jgi:hypothetical protein
MNGANVSTKRNSNKNQITTLEIVRSQLNSRHKDEVCSSCRIDCKKKDQCFHHFSIRFLKDCYDQYIGVNTFQSQ